MSSHLETAPDFDDYNVDEWAGLESDTKTIEQQEREELTEAFSSDKSESEDGEKPKFTFTQAHSDMFCQVCIFGIERLVSILTQAKFEFDKESKTLVTQAAYPVLKKQSDSLLGEQPEESALFLAVIMMVGVSWMQFQSQQKLMQAGGKHGDKKETTTLSKSD
ncbi:hypothetical protein [Vibrio sp. 10N.261.51.F12]|uniref:hypothetical protein n=1 Tax=Vibrio sp. 10N.261.51.F12 TaxID=3229679 RepID=UPI003552B95C